MNGAGHALSPGVRAFIALLLCAVAACDDARSLPQDAWVWRRQWTPALSQGVAGAPSALDRLRVLVVEQEPSGPVVVDIDAVALLAADRPVLATWRVAGSRPLAPVDLDVAFVPVLAQVQRLRAVGVEVVGVEVDHDCATARLPAYRDLLLALRTRLPDGLRLAITALPTWRDDPVALRALGTAVDELTVQLHAVSAPRLFDADTAVDVAVAFARAAGRDVGVALPTYAARTRDGPLWRVDTDEVGMVARRLRSTPGIVRIAWFRLGALDDTAAFPAATLAALLAGDPVVAEIVVETVPAADGALDVFLVNRGRAPGVAPSRTPLPVAAALVEAAPGVTIDSDDDDVAFVIDATIDDVALPAGARRRLGWLRPLSPCSQTAPPESP